jgi:hypothetical protein
MARWPPHLDGSVALIVSEIMRSVNRRQLTAIATCGRVSQESAAYSQGKDLIVLIRPDRPLTPADVVAYVRRSWPVRHWRISLAALAGLTAVLGGLYLTGTTNPFPRTNMLAELPAPLAPATYSRVAVDGSGWVWVAQSSAGLASHPRDPTLLTLLDPDQLFGDPVQARLCVACDGVIGASPGMPVPPLVRIDDIAGDPQKPHSIYIAGWTSAQGKNPAIPVVIRLDWHAGAATCRKTAPCATVTTLLDASTAVQFTQPDQKPLDLVDEVSALKASPVLSLATARNGDLFCFVSDRGYADPTDPTGILGGLQILIQWRPQAGAWQAIYRGPEGTYAAERLSPTSTVTAIAVDASERYLYAADSDHFSILRFDLRDPAIASPQALTAASAVSSIAGEPLAVPATGADRFQAISGWQGDGRLAQQARLGVVRGLAIDRDGDVIAADASDARLRLITPGGTMWTVAGNGAPVAGGGGSPLDASLGGVLGIAWGTGNRLYVIQGGLLDSSGHVALRVLNWGWLSPAYQTARSTSGDRAPLAAAERALPAVSNVSDTIGVLSATGCGQAPCVQPYLVASGGPNFGQLAPGAPALLDASDPALSGSDPLAATAEPGSDQAIVVLGNPSELAVLPCCHTATTPAATVPLPPGIQPTGLAVLAPTTDAQAAKLGGTFLVVAVPGPAGASASLLIYKAAVDPCGANPSPGCSPSTAAPSLVTTVSLAPEVSTGAVAVALSDDGSHAFALVSHPQENLVSAVDLSSLAAGKAPTVAARLPVPSPQSIVERHDGLAAYVAANGGQIATIETSSWLSGGVPAAIGANAVTLTSMGDSSSIATALALSSDDTHVYVALQSATGTATIATVLTGDFGDLTPPQVVGTTMAGKGLVALALTSDDLRLVALAAPGGTHAPGLLSVWATHDLAVPDQWLNALDKTGTAPTASGPRALVVTP